MCQSKELGGKRCFTHMKGTQAAISMAAAMSGLSKDFVTSVSRNLRKEGKGLPMPSEEEIVAFARNNQFISRHDVTIPDNMRKTLIRRWQDAEMERPDGGGFHAWKHTLVESVVRYKKNVARSLSVAGMVGVLAFTSSCSAGENIDNGNSPAPSETVSTAPVTPSETATPTPTPTSTNIDPEIPTAGVISNSSGEYLQTTIDPDKAGKLNEKVVQPGTYDNISKKDVAEVNTIAMKFIAEEVIDSEMNGDHSQADKWWKEHKDMFSDRFHDELRATLDDEGMEMILVERWQDRPPYSEQGYEYVTVPNETRVVNRTLKPTKINFNSDNGQVQFFVDVEFDMRANANGKEQLQHSNGDVALGFMKEDGKWKITAIRTTIATAQPAP